MNNTIQVTAAQLILAIVGAAGIGALVSSIINLAGQFFERQSRRKELLLAKSVELAISWSTIKVDIAKSTNQTPFIENPTVLTEINYKCLVGLIKHGEIPTKYRG